MSVQEEPTKEDLERAGKLMVAVGVLTALIEEDDDEDNREFLTEIKDDLAHVEAVLRGEEEEEEEE